MANFAEYFKVCKEEAENNSPELVIEETTDTDDGEIREELVEASYDIKESYGSADCAESVISNTKEQVAAQKQSLENPESITPAQVVLAAEAFRANLRLLDIEDSYSKTLSYVNSESVTSSPAQMLSLITADMENFIVNSENAFTDMINKIIEKIAAFIRKIFQAENILSKARAKLISEYEKLQDKNIKIPKEGLPKLYVSFPAVQDLIKKTSVKDILQVLSYSHNKFMGEFISVFDKFKSQTESVDSNAFYSNLKDALNKSFTLKIDNKPIVGYTKNTISTWEDSGEGKDGFKFTKNEIDSPSFNTFISDGTGDLTAKVILGIIKGGDTHGAVEKVKAIETEVNKLKNNTKEEDKNRIMIWNFLSLFLVEILTTRFKTLQTSFNFGMGLIKTLNGAKVEESNKDEK